MKRLLVLFLLLSPAIAFSEVESMRLSYNGYNNIIVDHLTQRARLFNVSQMIYLVPLDETVVSVNLDNLVVDDDHLLYFYDGDLVSDAWAFNYTIDSDRLISMISVNPEFPFPVNELPLDVIDYLDFGEKVDVNDFLRLRAGQVVAGVNDYLTAVLLLGQWVHDYLDYSLVEPYNSTVVQATRVLADGQGVCDEFSVLFMSLARSVGMPVRYVTGYAFGGSTGLSDFGPHAWVEVYVPGHGWIGMDPTYGQFGWFDASHVTFSKSLNTSNNYINTQIAGFYPEEVSLTNQLPAYLRSGFGSQASGFIINSVINESTPLTAIVSFTKDLLGEGEYFLLNVSITNPFNYYIPLSYDVISTNSMEFINASNRRAVLLEPESTVSSYTLFKAPLLGSHVSHPFSVYVPMAGSFNTSVEVNPSLVPSSSIEELSLILNDDLLILESVELNDLALRPNLTYDGTTLFFSLRNKGNIVLNNLEVNVYGDLVVDESRVIPQLGINELINLSIPLEVNSFGESSVRVYVNYANNSLSDEVLLIAAQAPGLIINFEGNNSFSVDPEFTLRVLNNLGVNIPLINVTITTPRDSINSSFEFGQAPVYEIESGFPVSWLDFGENEVVFSINYVDDYGTSFSDELSVMLTREGEWWELLLDSISKFFNSIISFFNQ